MRQLNTVWGGALAIRRNDFEGLKIDEYWSNKVVDDMSLQKLFRQKHLKSVFVPFCLSKAVRHTGGIIENMFWYKRQLLYLKFYLPDLWGATIFTFFHSAFNYILLVVLGIFCIMAPSRGLIPYFQVVFVFSCLSLAFCVMLKPKLSDNFNIIDWAIHVPLFIICCAFTSILTLFTNSIRWKNVTYKIDKNGAVAQIIRE